MFNRIAVRCFAVAASLVLTAGTAPAAFQTFNLAYSGAAFGNAATASGSITIDLALLNNPGLTGQDNSPFVTAFSLTVSGANSGNGTFGIDAYTTSSIFGGFYIDTNGGTLDFGQELVGQPTAIDPFGTVPSAGNAGDFNIFSNGSVPAAPQGTFFFEITTAGGEGDRLYLTNFTPTPDPVNPVPAPGTLAMLGVGLASLAGWRRTRAGAV